MKKIIICFCLFLVACVAFSQEIEAKFVSRMAARQLEGYVVVSWQNPANFIDVVELYRSNTIINNEKTLETATKIAELTHGEEEFVDTPNIGQNFYAGIIRNSDNDFRNVIFVSFRNYTFKPVNVEQEKKLEIKSLRATNRANHIQLEWTYDGKDKNNSTVSIYRSLSPINSDFTLDQALKIANVSLSSMTYADMSVPNINYYYAIFFTDEKDHDYKADVNVTRNPVFISQNSNVLSQFDIDNFVPLPLLTFDTDPTTGKKISDNSIYYVPKKVPHSPRTAKTHQMFIDENQEIMRYLDEYRGNIENPTEVRLLDNEQVFISNEFALEYKLAQQLLLEKNYLDALSTLENLLCESLSNSLRDRVSYYAGQIYFVQNEYKQAYIYLSLASNSYPKETKPYLSAISRKLYANME